MWNSKLLGSLVVFVVLFTYKTANATLQDNESFSLKLETRCQNQTVQCYYCNSVNDKNCASLSDETLSFSYLKECHGCCVKVVNGMNWVHRSCTANYGFKSHHYSYHDCDSSSNRKACFCRRNMCNGSNTLKTFSNVYYLIPSLIYLFWAMK